MQYVRSKTGNRTEVQGQTAAHLKETGQDKHLSELFAAYQGSCGIIPETVEAMFSGHFLPWMESWEELQVSYVFASDGFYKHAMIALRNALELGLLSIYYNLNDDGHRTIQNWVNAKEPTPRLDQVWKKLQTHPNISAFDSAFAFQERFLPLNDLSNFVHSRGLKYSNRVGSPLPFGPRFLLDPLHLWIATVEKVIRNILLLHMLKYPISTIKYDYSLKFGVDIPSFGGLEAPMIERIEQLLDPTEFQFIRNLADQDRETQNILAWIESLPDMSAEEVDAQATRIDSMIGPISAARTLRQWAEGYPLGIRDPAFLTKFRGMLDFLETHGINIDQID